MSSDAWTSTRAAFGQAAAWFVGVSAQAAGHWDEAGLGEWTIRDLVGHTSRAMLTVESYLGQGATTVDVHSPVDYFRLVLASSGDPAAVAQRGRDAGVALGDDPTRAVAVIADRVVTAVSAIESDVLVATPVGGMQLADYLPTRTFELTVHTCDLAAALGVPAQVPELAARESVRLLGALAARAGQAGPLLLAATGRRGLPSGFTVLEEGVSGSPA